MKIAILNDIHIGPPLNLMGRLRAHSHLMEGALPRLLHFIEKRHAPDLIVNLGDLIRSEELQIDKKRYQIALNAFQKLNAKVLHVLGNHEIKKMSLIDVEKMWQEAGFQQKSYGMRDLGAVVVLWIGLAYENGTKNLFLPDEQLIWLEGVVSALNKPAIVFSHCTLDFHDVRGNFFFEIETPVDPAIFFLKNQQLVCDILSTSPWIKGVFQAHLHYFHAKTHQGIPYITCPAMGDNLCAPDVEENSPEIYTLLFIGKESLTVKAYSREFCFAGTDFIMR